jgi:predicted amidophosphoribosyltransferase
LVKGRSASSFDPPVPALVHALKYQGWRRVADFAGERMARLARLEWEAWRPDLVVPVPTTSIRRRERGYNPAGLLAASVARILGIPCVQALVRPREGPRQVGLPPSQRAANVRDVFNPDGALSGALRCQNVLLVDDVLTTGSTGAEAARVVGRCGAREVALVTFARALPETPGSGGTPD